MVTDGTRQTSLQPRTTLGEQVTFQKGYAFKSGWYTERGHRIVKVSDFTDCSVDAENRLCIPEEIAQSYLKYQLRDGDVVIQTVGSWPNNPASVVGKVVRVPESVSGSLLNQNAVKLTPSDSLRLDFLFYRLRAPDFKDYIVGTAQGAASQASITLESIRAFGFTLPSEEMQERIASILTAYDDLIENNTRRIKILEQMAQMLAREWFVNFRFPGHEKVKMVESEMGLIPAGWIVESLGRLAFITMGQSPSSEFYNKDGQGLPFHQGVTDFGKLFPINRSYCSTEGRMAERGDILMSVRAPVGRLNIAREKIVIGRGLSAIRSRSDQQELLFQHLKEQFREEDSMGSGTIFKAVTKDDVHGLKFLQPTSEVVDSFVRIVRPLFRQLEVLTLKNENLRTTRDLLLPKLVSGEVSVETLEEEALAETI